ncbi:MAG: hypothetical protein ACRCWG_13755 [Sarcina sp.]
MSSKKAMDLTYTCEVLEYISRITHNKMKDLINQLGEDGISHIYNSAESYHCDSLEYSGAEIIEQFEIVDGTYEKSDKVQTRSIGLSLGYMITRLTGVENYVSKLMEVGTSWWMDELDNYESDLWYCSPEFHRDCYNLGYIGD